MFGKTISHKCFLFFNSHIEYNLFVLVDFFLGSAFQLNTIIIHDSNGEGFNVPIYFFVQMGIKMKLR